MEKEEQSVSGSIQLTKIQGMTAQYARYSSLRVAGTEAGSSVFVKDTIVLGHNLVLTLPVMFLATELNGGLEQSSEGLGTV